MSLPEVNNEYLTLEQAEKIESASERAFALRCLLVGCLLKHQISVGSSVIDFLVVNPRKPRTSKEESGKLVEITLMKKEDKDKKTLRKKKKKNLNITGKRKERQIQSMRNSGHAWTILYQDNVRNILNYFE